MKAILRRSGAAPVRELVALSGGNASAFGGGGVAAGPAIFVDAGTLTTSNSGAVGATATGGAAGGSGATAGGADATPVFNYAGTVNGSSTAGACRQPLPVRYRSSSTATFVRSKNVR